MRNAMAFLASVAAAPFICFLSVGGAYAQAAPDCTIDSTPPTLTCGPGMTVFTDASLQAVIPDLAASLPASDNCTAPGSLIRTQSPAAGTVVGLGTHTITVTVTDAARNSNTCQTTLAVAPQRQPADVRIVNAPTEPLATVPQGTTTVQGSVRVEGTANVNVANTPTVDLAPGAAVSVFGTPTVTLAPRAEVGLAPGSSVDVRRTVPVSLVSSALVEALPVCNRCEVANAVWGGMDISFDAGESFKSAVLFTVPAGKRLVIEFVTVDGSTPLNQRAEASIVIDVGGSLLNYSLQLNRENHATAFGQRTSFETSRLVRIYADGGTDVRCSLTRSASSGNAFVQFRMCGYLVDMP